MSGVTCANAGDQCGTGQYIGCKMQEQQCVCDTEKSFEDDGSKCKYCDPTKFLILAPGKKVCVCAAGYGKDGSNETCVACKPGTAHKIGDSEATLVPCTEC